MKIQDLMSSGGQTVSPTASVGDAARLISREGVLPVVVQGRVVGVVSAEDLSQAPKNGSTRVEDVMQRDFFLLRPYDDIAKARTVMERLRTSQVVIADESQLFRGVISAKDLSFVGFRVEEVRVYRGPHFYSDTPMVRLQVDLGRLEEYPTDKLPGFVDGLLELLPGLHKHGCSTGRPGGFVSRLREGTWLGHVVEHVALELQNMAGCDVTRGKTRSVRGRRGVYNVMFAYRDEPVGLLAGRFALETVNSLLPFSLRGLSGLDAITRFEEEFDFGRALAVLRALASKYAFGPTTGALVKEAERRGIPWMRLDPDSSLVQLGYGSNARRIRASLTSCTSEVATEIAGDKDLTKQLLKSAGVLVPEGVVVRSADAAVAAAQSVGYPVVVKPLDGNHGRGVATSVRTEEEVRAAFLVASAVSSSVIVEKYFTGDDHRVLVVNGEAVAVAKRIPAHVIGDGAQSVRELVEEENKNPLRGEGHECFLTRIVLDESVLMRNGTSADSVPKKGEVVWLQQTANLSSGGTAEDVTDRVHPDNKAMAERAAAMVGLDVAGIDFIAPDISKSVYQTGGGVIEVNACPGLRMHIKPSIGLGRNVARPIIDSLFPAESDGRIPIVAVTGTNGKTTTCRMISHVLEYSGKSVGMTCTNGVYLKGVRIAETDASGPKSAAAVLKNPCVDAAVFETARGGILREGLGFPSCDVGVVLNVAADHLGLKGVDTLEDLAKVKSVVIESVRRKGFSVLNADCPVASELWRHAGGRTIYFSMASCEERPAFLSEHIEKGGIAVVCEETFADCDIVVYDGGLTYPIVSSKNIPATLNGLAKFNVANALAAIAVAYALGVKPALIKSAMSTFAINPQVLPGRLNFFQTGGVEVIVDYAHNPHGLEALGGLVKSLRSGQGRVIGAVAIAGDRRDADIREMGRLAVGYFDEIVFHEDEDKRGRDSGEVAALMREGALSAGADASKLHTVLEQNDSILFALGMSRPGDLVVLTVDPVDSALETVERYVRDFRRRKNGKKHSARASLQ